MSVFFTHPVQVVRGIDWWFVVSLLFLLGIGLVTQYTMAVNQFDGDLSGFYKQCIIIGISLFLFLLLTFFDHRFFAWNPAVYWTIAFLVLLSVLFFGTELKGTTGWFIIGSFSLQPVEFVKIAVMLFMASYVKREIHILESPKHSFITAAAVATLVLLIFRQPDLGSALVIFILWFSAIIYLKSPKWFIALVAIGVVLASVLGWFFLFEDYQKARLSTFIDPSADPTGTGYNVTQSLVAVGSGSLFGKGLGFGTQSQLQFLPEATSDFIFAVIAEELGFFGVLALLIALSVLLYRIWLGMVQARDQFAFVFIYGVFIYLLIQSIMVIGMNIGILPVTGVPLPLISAGGSSMLATLIMLGIVHNVRVNQK